MMRGYAIGMGAGTQALILMAGEMIAVPPSELSRVLLVGAAWVINLAVAEWVIRRRLAFRHFGEGRAKEKVAIPAAHNHELL
jgi:hypothetical protein